MFGTQSLIPSIETLVPANRDLADPFASLRREIDRLFDAFFASAGLPTAVTGRAWELRPQLDLIETDDDYQLVVELPGVDPNDIVVELRGDVLTVRGEKKAEHEEKAGNRYLLERRFGRFERHIRLPTEIDRERAEATYDKGVLTIRLPKPAAAQKPVKKIEVKAA